MKRHTFLEWSLEFFQLIFDPEEEKKIVANLTFISDLGIASKFNFFKDKNSCE